MAGAPNFRQVAGFPIFGCAQPTEEGFKNILEKVPKGSEEKVVDQLSLFLFEMIWQYKGVTFGILYLNYSNSIHDNF